MKSKKFYFSFVCHNFPPLRLSINSDHNYKQTAETLYKYSLKIVNFKFCQSYSQVMVLVCELELTFKDQIFFRGICACSFRLPERIQELLPLVFNEECL